MGLLDFQPRRVRMELMPGPSVMDNYAPSVDAYDPSTDALSPPAVLGGLLSLDPTDYLSGSAISKGLLGVGMAIPKKAQMEALSKLEALRRGESVNKVVKDGLIPTKSQQDEINAAFSALTAGKQPPYTKSAMDIALGHVYDARVSGQIKPSGRKADKFSPEDTVSYMAAAGDDTAQVVKDNLGRPALRNLYVDPVTGESVYVRLPISGDMLTGKQWVSGLVPEKKYKR